MSKCINPISELLKSSILTSQRKIHSGRASKNVDRQREVAPFDILEEQCLSTESRSFFIPDIRPCTGCFTLRFLYSLLRNLKQWRHRIDDSAEFATVLKSLKERSQVSTSSEHVVEDIAMGPLYTSSTWRL